MRRNSTPEFAEEDASDLIEDAVKCGYQREKLINLVAKLNREDGTDNTKSMSTSTLVIPFFIEIGELKGLLKSLQSDTKILTGNDTHTLIAARKGMSVASVVVKNNQLCATSESTSSSGGQRCGSNGCVTCPTIVQDNEALCANGRILSPGIQLNCKSSNVIYLARCTICDPVQDNGDINCYAAQTIQPLHNGHRSCFDVNENLQIWEKSALSKHASESHQDNFDIRHFKIMAHRQGYTKSLEAKTIN